MPFFSNRFHLRSSKPRKSGSHPELSKSHDSYSQENDSLKTFKALQVNLGDDICLQYDENKGEWVTMSSSSSSSKSSPSSSSGQNRNKIDENKIELEMLKSAYKSLLQENRLLKLKIELLIDLVSILLNLIV